MRAGSPARTSASTAGSFRLNNDPMIPEPTRIKTAAPSPYQLTAIHQDTHDTKTFHFGLPAGATLDMLPGNHLYVYATINGKTVKRPYTPSSLPGVTGHF